MHLIHSKIVPADQNIFWDTLPDAWLSLPACRCLVLTQAYPSGSAEEQTLVRMLGACHLSPEQYHILSFQPNQRVAWHKLRSRFEPEFVLLLGIYPASLGIAALFHIHDPNNYDGSCFIPALSLTEMEKNAEAKKDFWLKGLKPTFAPGS